MEGAAARQTCERIGSITGEHAICLIKASGENANKSEGHFRRRIQRIHEIYLRNHEAHCPLERNYRCGPWTLSQDAEFSKHFALRQFAKKHFRRIVWKRFDDAHSTGENDVNAMAWFSLTDDGMTGWVNPLRGFRQELIQLV